MGGQCLRNVAVGAMLLWISAHVWDSKGSPPTLIPLTKRAFELAGHHVSKIIPPHLPTLPRLPRIKITFEWDFSRYKLWNGTAWSGLESGPVSLLILASFSDQFILQLVLNILPSHVETSSRTLFKKYSIKQKFYFFFKYKTNRWLFLRSCKSRNNTCSKKRPNRQRSARLLVDLFYASRNV